MPFIPPVSVGALSLVFGDALPVLGVAPPAPVPALSDSRPPYRHLLARPCQLRSDRAHGRRSARARPDRIATRASWFLPAAASGCLHLGAPCGASSSSWRHVRSVLRTCR